MKLQKKDIKLGFYLLVAAVCVYFIQIVVFKDPSNTFFYLLQDLAFVPLNIVILTLIVDRVLAEREKKDRMQKMNMAIGMFYNEAGIALLKCCIGFDSNFEQYHSRYHITMEWEDAQFDQLLKRSDRDAFQMDSRRSSLIDLKLLLVEKKELLLTLLSNPVLLEHDTFSDLLWSVFHLKDELQICRDFSQMDEDNHRHISRDIERAYGYLISQWILYMKHLRTDYPYLYSLAVRENPFR